jgi:thymidylate synthase
MEGTSYNQNQLSAYEEHQYIDLVDKILKEGFWEEGRNGRTKGIFGYTMRFSLKDDNIPIFTTKKTAWKTCLKELLWFIRGETNNKLLQQQNVHIWDGNTSREFLDSIGLLLYEEGIAGPIYGYQWRNFNAKYNCVTGKPIANNFEENDRDFNNITFRGVDQLQYIINSLKDPVKRTSRRLIMTAWNPCQLNEMALPPCHVMCQFNVLDGNKLSCALYQRSNDVSLGTSFNVASYSFLTHLLAKHCGLVAHEFIHFMGNCHIYEEHIEPMKELLNREFHSFPKINIKNIKENINDYEIDDFEIIGYKSNDVIKMQMVA